MSDPHFVILGAGPAGCGGAAQLRRGGHGKVTLVERGAVAGGNAGSFLHGGIWLDFGSHRLHSAVDPAILADIYALLGDDLGHFDRHGRIRLRNRWLHFPIKALDLLLHLNPGFALSMLRDMAQRTLLPRPPEGNTFASVLRANLGPTMCEQFYFPYARKLWGRDPSELSGIQARKRVTAGSFSKLLKRLVKPPGKGKFYYPREGYGQISRAYADAAVAAGADLRFNTSVEGLERPGADGRWRVTLNRGGVQEVLEADHVWSTIPVTQVARMMRPAAPPEVLAATEAITYQGMILVYLVVEVDQWTTTDAHYFPESNVSVTRVSEPKNYFLSKEPKGRTVLCAEVPCTPDGALWQKTDAELGELVAADLARAEIPLPKPAVEVFTRRLRQAYPIYTLGYEHDLGTIDRWVESLPGFLSYGRQGLFAHDNLHHALFMAYSAVDCVQAGQFDQDKWAGYRKIFATHVVED
ncbi:MAG: FAD-dependent oxidoreductase [Gemmatimonadota bacterium]|nr:FAD-dependent oxidoreductase [Gemmatimonadota bacterium]